MCGGTGWLWHLTRGDARNLPCEGCGGVGRFDGVLTVECPHCHGGGFAFNYTTRLHTESCACEGHGRWIAHAFRQAREGEGDGKCGSCDALAGHAIHATARV